MWHIKKLTREREEQRRREQNKDVNEPELVLPQLAGRIENKAYMPSECRQPWRVALNHAAVGLLQCFNTHGALRDCKTLSDMSAFIEFRA